MNIYLNISLLFQQLHPYQYNFANNYSCRKPSLQLKYVSISSSHT